MEQEEWRPVPLPDLEGYLVSSLGRIARVLFLSKRRGYYRLEVQQGNPSRYKAGYSVARLVALGFVGESPGADYEAHHRSYDPTDNRPGNLEWRHKDQHGNRQRRLTEDDAREIIRLRARGMVRPLAERFGVSTHLIKRIWEGGCWKRVQPPLPPKRPNKRGANNGNALLNEDQVRAIKAARGVVSGKALAERYRISTATVSAIWRGQNWAWLPDTAAPADPMPQSGEHNPQAKLTEQAVREIKAAKGTTSGRELAQQHGVSPSTISMIWSGKSWSHIPA